MRFRNAQKIELEREEEIQNCLKGESGRRREWERDPKKGVGKGGDDNCPKEGGTQECDHATEEPKC